MEKNMDPKLFFHSIFGGPSKIDKARLTLMWKSPHRHFYVQMVLTGLALGKVW